MGLFTDCQLHSANVSQSGSSDKCATAPMTANEGTYYSFLYSCDIQYYWFRWHDGQGISSNVCTGVLPDQPLHYKSQTAKLIFFLYALPFRNNKMLGWDAINFFFPLREYAACSQVQQVQIFFFSFSFFFHQNYHKHLSNTNLLCMYINYTGRGTLSI